MNDIFPSQDFNTGYIDEIFARYQADSHSVGIEWQAFFKGFQQGFSTASALAQDPGQYAALLQTVSQTPSVTATRPQAPAAVVAPEDQALHWRVAAFVCAWRAHGHYKAQTNPLEPNQNAVPQLEPSFYGITPQDMGKSTQAGILVGLPTLTIQDLCTQLAARFAGTVGAEFEHVVDPEERQWLFEKLGHIYDPVPKQTKLHLFQELAKADALEKTIASKYIGKKRFSIEGADAQIPAFHSFLEESIKCGAEECTVAIAHRGRLNFLVHAVGKPLENLIAEWEGIPHEGLRGDGDVKYHYGYESVRPVRDAGQIRVAMPFNPSHLEVVDSIVMGDTRARQQAFHHSKTDKVTCIVFHGDAAVAGQGIVFENAQMMTLHGYAVGGTVHVVANNQVGFTTNPEDARSSSYCTDVAKVTGSPVLHVNADDIDTLHNVMVLCAQYRARFQKDIYVDLVCFRRYGHNEADEPNFTQPLLYKLIKDKPAPYESYLTKLTSQGLFTDAELKDFYNGLRTQMNAVCDAVKSSGALIQQFKFPRSSEQLSIASEQDMLKPVQTAVPMDTLKSVAAKLCTVPSEFHANQKLSRIIIAERAEMAQGNKRVDWGMAEILAYGTLLQEGYDVRLSGEDCQRGTFSHRHAVLIDNENGKPYCSLATINPASRVEIINSHLSEEAVMGFEYGFSACHVKSLCLWEAQFGDFVNGAQIILDQFLAAGEAKWQQQSGLVLLLPHGLEGMGAEHSSARLERFLQQSAQGNWYICSFTRADQLFHSLRRQALAPFRKPLVLMTPKSFLRSPRASCTLEDLAKGSFQPILDDERITNRAAVKRVLLCSGKIALDLLDALEKPEYASHTQTTAIVRLEQIYPLDTKALADLLATYKNAKIVWVQEEPKNMGAWSFVHAETAHLFAGQRAGKLFYVGRSRRATPAVGLEKRHHLEQDKVIRNALESEEDYDV